MLSFPRLLSGSKRSKTRTHSRARNGQPKTRFNLCALERREVPATITVTHLLDDTNVDTQVSLREAIESINLGANLNSDVVAVGTYGTNDSITFAGALSGTIVMNGAEMSIMKSMKITGPGASSITLNANDASRHFKISDGAATQITVDISGMTFLDGSIIGGFGGSIFNDGEILTVSNSSFISNKTDAFNNGGGAIATGNPASVGKLTIIGCTFDANSAGTGGPQNAGSAIWAGAGAPSLTGDNDIVIQNSTFKNNSTISSGAIAMFGNAGGGSSLNISNSTFNNNTAGEEGGAIWVAGKINANGLSISNTTVTSNTSGVGGGVYISISNSTERFFIANSTIVDNVATFGSGGGVALRIDTSSVIDIENTVIAGNKSATVAPDLSVTKANGTTGVFQVANNSLIGIYDAANGPVAGAFNQLGTLAFPLDPVLAPLANNGGPTETRRPYAGSPLVDVSVAMPILTTLNAALSATGTSATVVSTANLAVGAYLLIDAEIVQISAITSPTTIALGSFFTPLRGLFGTTAVAHAIGASLTIPFTQPATDQRGNARPVNGKYDIGSVEIENDTPAAKLNAPLPLITAPGQTPYAIQVRYTDDVALKTLSIDDGVGGNDMAIRVLGPGGYNQLANFVGIVSNTGTEIIANYTITSPGPNWTSADNGYYTVWTEPNQVQDLAGKFVEQYQIGLTRVSLPLSLVVDSDNDEATDSDSKLSLREAIIAANNNIFAPDTITFSPAFFATPKTINLNLGELHITDQLVINNTNGVGNVTIKGVNSRIFTIDTPGTKTPISLMGLTMTGGTGASTIAFGAGASGGGAIMNYDEALTVDGCVITANDAGAGLTYGGGILINTPNATLTLVNSTVSNNTAATGGGGISLQANNTSMAIQNSIIVGNRVSSGSGGGINSSPGGGPGLGGSSITIDNSTIANNQAVSAGGMAWSNGQFAIPGRVIINNSTFSGNIATTGSAGGIAFPSSSYITLRNSTITGNSARTSGGGITLPNPTTYGSNVAIINSIIAGNVNKFTPDISGGSTTTPFTMPVINSIIGAVDTTVTKINNIGSQIGSLTTPVNALLGPLVYNGGSTGMLTHMPLPGSPALNMGVNVVPTITLTNLAAAATAGSTTIKVDSAAVTMTGVSYDIGGEIVTFKSKSSTTITLNAPLVGSYSLGTAINRIAQPAAPANDQRGAGFSRILGGTIDVGATEVDPTLPVAYASFAPVTTDGGVTQNLTITFADDVGMNVSTIKNNNAVRVTGPGGFSVLATYVPGSISIDANGTPRSATYQFSPPTNGKAGWDYSDNGTYSVSIEPGQVADTNGNFVFSTTVNNLQVAIGRNFVVLNDLDQGSGSLRQAILDSNANIGIDTITFDSTFFSTAKTILVGALGEMFITDPVSIVGPGAAFAIVDGAINPGVTEYRIFNIDLPAAHWGDAVNISGLKLIRGGGLPVVGAATSGGAIRNESATLNIDDCEFEDNGNLNFSGGVFSLNSIYAPANITDSKFTLNGGLGGGIGNIGGGISTIPNSLILNVSNSTFDGTVNGAFSGSGGVFNVSNGGTVNIQNSKFTNNLAGTGSGSGAVILLGTNSTANISDSTFENNIAGTSGNGGAININSSTAVANIVRSSFITNTASQGGAIFVASGGKLNLDSSTLSGNFSGSVSANNGGGGIYMTGAAQVTITNSTLSGNNASNFGGGIHISSLTNSATPSLAGSLLVRNSTIAYNTATVKGGGISFRTSSSGTPSVNIISSIVSENTSPVGTDLNSNTGNATTTFTVNNSFIGVLTDAVITGANNKNTASDGSVNLNPTLASNGAPIGSPLTHAFNGASAAIDNGSNPAGLGFDQRGSGFSRTVNLKTDMGAFEAQNATPLPTVSSIKVNDGLSTQRSIVTSMTITFSEAVTFPNGIPAAFTLTRTTAPTGGALGSVNVTGSMSGNVLTLTFLNGGAVTLDPGNSLPDGKYTLNILSNQVAGVGGFLDGTMNNVYQGSPIDDVSSSFFRLFGDGDGNGAVTSDDFSLFRQTFGTNMNLAFDFDNDGQVDSDDFSEFRKRFGLVI